jgi:septal ring factor EnvC (AmiA/AmiB activator)
MSDDTDKSAGAVPITKTGKELHHLRNRIDQQSRQLNRHARELTALHNDLAALDQRIDAHQHRDG